MEMRGVVTHTPQSWYSPCSRPPRIATKILRCDVFLPENLLFSSNLRVSPSGFPRISLRCNGIIGDSGGNECKAMLEAFFLGNALGEVINDRIQSTVGEFFSVIGGLQADFLKQARKNSRFESILTLKKYLQEDVLERTSRARVEAMREAKDGIELVSKSIEGGISAVDDVASNASTSVSPLPWIMLQRLHPRPWTQCKTWINDEQADFRRLFQSQETKIPSLERTKRGLVYTLMGIFLYCHVFDHVRIFYKIIFNEISK